MEKEDDPILAPDGVVPDDGINEVEKIPSSDYEYLMSAVNAFECVEGSNPITKDAQRMVNRIKRKSLNIIDYIIGIMHDELFDEEKEQDD